MRNVKYIILCALLAIAFTGCGQRVVETLHVAQDPGPNAPGAGSVVVILPFADYTDAGNIASAYRRNLKVSEALADSLVSQGFSLPVAEDVFKYLVHENLISVAAYEKSTNVSLANELANSDWSPQMRERIKHYLGEQQVTNRHSVAEAPGTHALDTNAVVKLGRSFKADYIVRGRILEFTARQDPSWVPWRKGLLPVVTGSTARIVYGFAGSDEYDSLSQMMTAGLIGLGVTSGSDWPVGDGLDISGGVAGNEVFWAGAGGLLGNQASKAGKIDQAVVQLRIWVQDATTGQVVWTNRAMVRVSPESVFADGQWDDLFNTAIEKGVATLVDNFVTVGL